MNPGSKSWPASVPRRLLFPAVRSGARTAQIGRAAVFFQKNPRTLVNQPAVQASSQFCFQKSPRTLPKSTLSLFPSSSSREKKNAAPPPPPPPSPHRPPCPRMSRPAASPLASFLRSTSPPPVPQPGAWRASRKKDGAAEQGRGDGRWRRHLAGVLGEEEPVSTPPRP